MTRAKPYLFYDFVIVDLNSLGTNNIIGPNWWCKLVTVSELKDYTKAMLINEMNSLRFECLNVQWDELV